MIEKIAMRRHEPRQFAEAQSGGRRNARSRRSCRRHIGHRGPSSSSVLRLCGGRRRSRDKSRRNRADIPRRQMDRPLLRLRPERRRARLRRRWVRPDVRYRCVQGRLVRDRNQRRQLMRRSRRPSRDRRQAEATAPSRASSNSRKARRPMRSKPGTEPTRKANRPAACPRRYRPRASAVSAGPIRSRRTSRGQAMQLAKPIRRRADGAQMMCLNQASPNVQRPLPSAHGSANLDGGAGGRCT